MLQCKVTATYCDWSHILFFFFAGKVISGNCLLAFWTHLWDVLASLRVLNIWDDQKTCNSWLLPWFLSVLLALQFMTKNSTKVFLVQKIGERNWTTQHCWKLFFFSVHSLFAWGKVNVCCISVGWKMCREFSQEIRSW